MRKFILGLACGVLVSTGAIASASTGTHPPRRPCPEDAIWAGSPRAQYSGGYWSHYTCVSGDSATQWWLNHH